MLDYLGLVTVIIGLFALAAGLLWVIERRRRGEPVPELHFLVTQHGFAPALTEFGAGDLTHTFKRGADEVNVVAFGRATTEVVIRASGKTLSVRHLSLETLASRLRAHPEILQGDFAALSVAHGDA